MHERLNMSLINCPECGKEISASAEICPNCGFPIKKHLNTTKEKSIVVKKEPAPKKSHPLLTVLIVFLVIGGLTCSGVFLAKYAAFKKSNGNTNRDGNPITLTRSATVNDFSFEQDVEATITNLKDTYKIVPKVDIKSLSIKISYYKQDNSLLKSVTQSIGDVYANSTHRFSVSHTLSDIYYMYKYSYNVVGGTVSYFS